MKRAWINLEGLLWIIGLLLTGCGGGGGGAAPTTSISGVVADGYLVGARVCLDRNNNKKCDADEPTATTTAGGAYTLPPVPVSDAGRFPVLVEVAAGVVDEERGPVTQPYILTAPAGRYGFVSPLTTLVQYQAETGNLSADAAEQALRNQLGFTLSLFDDYRPGDAAATTGQRLAAALARRVTDAQAAAQAAHSGVSGQELFSQVQEQVVGQLAAIVQQAQNDVAPLPPPTASYAVTPVAGSNGSISPATAQSVSQGATASFNVVPASGYDIASVTGCGGSLSGSTYTTGVVTGACTVTASFSTSAVITDSTTGMVLLKVPGGTYTMGDTFGDGSSSELPTHQVTVGEFYIGKYEVTQGQWQAVMGSNPSSFTACGANCPVESVNWADIQTFITTLNQRSGKNYRLPTEAEWEYAARSGGQSQEYSGGSDINAVAWYTGNSGGTTHPVGQKQANGLGLYDMSGNVDELVSDWFALSYSATAQTNPTGPATGSFHVYRGGSWLEDPFYERASYRGAVVVPDRGNPTNRYSNIGFRLVAPVP